MSFKKTYLEAKAAHKEMKRSKLTSKASKGKLKRGRFKRKPVSPEGKQWREQVLERDGYRCRWINEDGERCPISGAENLEAHHIHERSQRPDLKLDLTNGAATCVVGPYWHHDHLHHTVKGRQRGRDLGLLGTETYEKAVKQK